MIYAAMACVVAGSAIAVHRFRHHYDSVPYSAWSLAMYTLFGIGWVFTVFGLLAPA